MSTRDEGAVTSWIERLGKGDLAAAQPLWERYFECVVRLARDELRSRGRGGGVADEEDAALSAFDSLFTGIRMKKFPRLADRDDLWRILMTITIRKASDQLKHGGRQRRGGGRVVAASVLAGPEREGRGPEWTEAPEPSPALAAMLAEEFQTRIAGLPDVASRRVAILTFEGYTGQEIAERLDCTPRTVARKLALIRRSWSPGVEP